MSNHHTSRATISPEPEYSAGRPPRDPTPPASAAIKRILIACLTATSRARRTTGAPIAERYPDHDRPNAPVTRIHDVARSGCSRSRMKATDIQSLLQRAQAHHVAGRLTEAAPLYQRVLAATPHDFAALHLAGTLAFQQQRFDDAAGLLRRALRAKSKSAPTEMVLGLTESALGRRTEAEKYLRDAVAHAPDNVEARQNLAALLVITGRLPEALETYQHCLRQKPDQSGLHSAFGSALLLAGRADDAIAAHTRALELDPRNRNAHACRAQAYLACGKTTEALADFDIQLERTPDHLDARSHRLMLLNYLDTVTPDQVAAEHRAYGQRVAALRSRPPAAATPVDDLDRRLRVAFLSPDLREHSVACFLEPLLRHLDRTQFEIVLYHDHLTTDAVSDRLRAGATLWRNFVGFTGDQVERQIRADTPDVLIDLAGHTGFNRLPLFARRLAPVQITYLGYPNTTGVPEMDFRFTDAIADPLGPADQRHTEELVRFGPTNWAYQPPTYAPPPPPARTAATDRAFSFGSFNNPSKLSPSTLRLWARIVAAVPGSQLVLKGARLDHQALRATLLRSGFVEGSFRLLPPCPTAREHLAAYQEMDVALDPSPYNGTTTTCEALWMGRPVLTLAGDHHASRVGASLLTAAGHPEWIAHDENALVALARRLAAPEFRPDLVRLAQTLRLDLAAGPLLDHPGQANRFGAALRACWHRRIHSSATHETGLTPAVCHA